MSRRNNSFWCKGFVCKSSSVASYQTRWCNKRILRKGYSVPTGFLMDWKLQTVQTELAPLRSNMFLKPTFSHSLTSFLTLSRLSVCECMRVCVCACVRVCVCVCGGGGVDKFFNLKEDYPTRDFLWKSMN